MKKLGGIVLAAAFLLCSCKDTALPAGTSSSGGSISEPSLSPSDSKPAFSGADEGESREIDKKMAIPADKSYSVADGEVIRIIDGGELTINGESDIDENAKIIIDEGGRLVVNGKMTLDGDITIKGSLKIGEDGCILGKGVIAVTDKFDDIDCEGEVTAKIKPPAPVTENGVTYVGGVLLVNKKYAIPETFGSELIIDDDIGTGLITDETYDALLEMREFSGYEMPIASGFRSFNTQKVIFNRYVERDGFEEASTYSAEPGHSEHQTGLAIDITSTDESYGYTEEGMWLAAHCHEFGFIIRYPKGKEPITGYIYEPWHVRYLGKSMSRLVHSSGLTLEEFLGVA